MGGVAALAVDSRAATAANAPMLFMLKQIFNQEEKVEEVFDPKSTGELRIELRGFL